jgi:hypothetical protein
MQQAVSIALVLLSAICAPAAEPEKFIEVGHGELMAQEDVQNLLAGAVCLAVRKDDVDLLRKLRATGWDPKQVIEQPRVEEDEWPVLHAAVYHASPRTVEWLLTECGLKRDRMGRYNEFAIRWALVGELDADKRKIIDLLKRPSDGGLAGLVDCLVAEVGDVEPREGQRIIVNTSDTPDPKLVFERLKNRNKAIEAAKDGEDPEAKLDNGDVEAVSISITKTGDSDYDWSIDRTSGPMSGGRFGGSAKSQYGYWILETLNMADY